MNKKSKPTLTAITKTEIDAKVAKLQKERDDFVEKANMQIVSYNSKIELLTTLLDPEEAEIIAE